MSYAVVRVQKMTSGGVKGIEIHDLREKEHSNTNPDIDYDRSIMNYDLCPKQNQNFQQAVKERIAELNLPKAVRKDAIVLGQVLVTSDSDFFEELKMMEMNSLAEASHSAYASGEPFSPFHMGSPSYDYTKEFFEKAYEYLADRYGRENVVSAVVHMDEGNPHMHFNFVPVTEDGRLCAKEVFSRERLINQQDTFHEQVGKEYGLLRGETKDKGKRRKHLETAEYKEAMQMVAEARESLKEAKNELSAIQEQTEAKKAEMERELPVLEERINEAKSELQVLESAIKEKMAEGEAKFTTSGLKEQLERARQEVEKEKRIKALEARLSLFERFISLPKIKPLWEQFQALISRNKPHKEHEGR